MRAPNYSFELVDAHLSLTLTKGHAVINGDEDHYAVQCAERWQEQPRVAPDNDSHAVALMGGAMDC